MSLELIHFIACEQMTAFSSARQVPVLHDMSTNKIKKSNKKVVIKQKREEKVRFGTYAFKLAANAACWS